jgi:hypothetical protein
MNPAKRRAIFERLRAGNPHPKSELDHGTPFELLVAVVLSAQSTDKGVNKATAKLFPVANTPATIARLGVEGLVPYVQSIGLFRNKAKNIVALSEILLREHGGEVPATAGRRAQDRQRRPQRRIRAADDRRRHAHFPRREPHRTCAGQDARGSRAQASEIRARRVSSARPSLADPARPLRLCRTCAELRRVSDSRPVRVPRQDRLTRCSVPRATRPGSS